MFVLMVVGSLVLGADTKTGAKQAQPPMTVVTGYVADLRTTGQLERLAWGVEDDQQAVTLLKARDDEQLGYICIWGKGLLPREGARVIVRGRYHGRTLAGAAVYVDCSLVR